MPGCSFLEWPLFEDSYQSPADDYDTSEIQKLIVARHLLQAAVGDSDAG
jgi:hypothetical protein